MKKNYYFIFLSVIILFFAPSMKVLSKDNVDDLLEQVLTEINTLKKEIKKISSKEIPNIKKELKKITSTEINNLEKEIIKRSSSTLRFKQCDNKRYNCTPKMCTKLCNRSGLKIAHYTDVYYWATLGKTYCAYLWMLGKNTHDNKIARAFPMYVNRITSGCGRMNTGIYPRLEDYTEYSWNTKTKADCVCINK